MVGNVTSSWSLGPHERRMETFCSNQCPPKSIDGRNFSTTRRQGINFLGISPKRKMQQASKVPYSVIGAWYYGQAEDFCCYVGLLQSYNRSRTCLHLSSLYAPSAVCALRAASQSAPSSSVPMSPRASPIVPYLLMCLDHLTTSVSVPFAQFLCCFCLPASPTKLLTR